MPLDQETEDFLRSLDTQTSIVMWVVIFTVIGIIWYSCRG